MNIHMQGNSWKKAKYYVYVICNNEGIHYVGVTNNPERRISQHRDGTGARFTARQPCRDWQLHWLWYFDNFADAHRWEKVLHKCKKSGVERLIQDHPEVDSWIKQRIALIPINKFDLMTDRERGSVIQMRNKA